jgi:hypothetical protein
MMEREEAREELTGVEALGDGGGVLGSRRIPPHRPQVTHGATAERRTINISPASARSPPPADAALGRSCSGSMAVAALRTCGAGTWGLPAAAAANLFVGIVVLFGLFSGASALAVWGSHARFESMNGCVGFFL